MPQWDTNSSLSRMALQYGSQVVTLAINPQQYTIQFPHRTSTVKTMNSVTVQDFGNGIGTIQFTGNTGWRKDANGSGGKERMEALQSILTNYTSASNNGMRPTSPLTFYNNTDDYSYTVHVDTDGWKIDRDSQNPLWYVYAVNLLILKPAGEVDPNNRASSELGNIYPTISGSSSQQVTQATGTSTTSNDLVSAATNPNYNQSTAQVAASKAVTQSGG